MNSPNCTWKYNGHPLVDLEILYNSTMNRYTVLGLTMDTLDSPWWTCKYKELIWNYLEW